MTKKELATKIAKEQNLDATKLMRLTVAELEKMDLVVPDQELPTDTGSDENESEVMGDGALDSSEHTEGSGDDNKPGSSEDDVDIFDGVELEEDPADVVEETPVHVERKLVGHHPITKEPVYR